MGNYSTTVDYEQQKHLLDTCAKGDQRSHKKFYDMFAPVMYGICLRYADSNEEAKDWLQEGFIKAFANLTVFRNEGSLEGWLKRIFVNHALEQVRHKKILFKTVPIDIGIENAEQAPYNFNFDSKMDQKQILALINTLPIGCRTVFNLFIIEGYSHQEIATMLEVTEGTSKSQLARARQLMQQKLTNKVIANNEQF